MIPFIQRWKTFLQERFPLRNHLPLLVVYFLANAGIAAHLSPNHSAAPVHQLLGFLVVFFIFLHLRIFDEIKDFPYDQNIHPERPLARGLVSLSEAKFVAIILIAMEFLLSLILGKAVLAALLCTVIYSLIMYKEFFIGTWLRPRLTTYALVHTPVSCWIALFIYSLSTGNQFWQAPSDYLWFVLSNWLIFNIFEFGRKTFGRDEECPLIESYSKRFGPQQAAVNVLAMALLAVVIAFHVGTILVLNKIFFILMESLFLTLLLAAARYGYSTLTKPAQNFRAVCSIFIFLYNAIFLTAIVLKSGALWKL